MLVTTLSQPAVQLGTEVDKLLETEAPYTKIILVSAFVGLRTILRLRERLLHQKENGARVRLIVGIDLGGTSREVLQELLRWGCEVSIIHNPLPRTTFHPKLYLFEGARTATLIVGSNNLTDGGFYSNYEAATRLDFALPTDEREYQRVLRPLRPILHPEAPIVQGLTAALIETLIARGELQSEEEARKRRREQGSDKSRPANAPANPFGAVAVPLPPLLPQRTRQDEPTERHEPPKERRIKRRARAQLPGALVWRKVLPASDALQVGEGTHHVGGVRLTQAGFESPDGSVIDQTTYFRRLFANHPWEPERGGRRGQEHAFVPMHVVIKTTDYGVRNFEISHKPSGEAGQANYTTILRWGRTFTSVVLSEELTGHVLSLYEVESDEAAFLMRIE